MRKQATPSGTLLIAARDYVSATGSRYVVEVGVSSARTEETVRQVLLILAVGLPIAVSVAVAGGFMLVRRALKPVDNLSQKAAEITQHNLSERLPVMRTADELERLSVSLNLMISRLRGRHQQLETVRGGCIARVAHAAGGLARRAGETSPRMRSCRSPDPGDAGQLAGGSRPAGGDRRGPAGAVAVGYR